MALQIGQRTDHGFDEPLGLLSDCHRRIEHFLEVLVALSDHAAGGTLAPSYRSSLETALRYFEVAAPKHTADEEASLFPRLRDSRDPATRDALASLDALEQDHDEAEALHAAVNELVRRWLADGRLAQPDADRLRGLLKRLRTLYRRHIRVEERDVFPAAARVLDRAQIAAIGGEMAERRNVRLNRENGL
jgi:hemerythrin-like domain-containing protein